MNATFTPTNKRNLPVLFRKALILVLLLSAFESWAQTPLYFRTKANSTGSWQANSTWQFANSPFGPYSNTTNEPGPGDIVEITRSINIPANFGATCQSLTISDNSANVTLTFGDNAILTVMQDVQVFSPGNNFTNTIDLSRGGDMVVKGSVILGLNNNTGNVVLTAAGNSTLQGTFVVKGDLNVTNTSSCKLELTNQGQFEIGGGFIGNDLTFALGANTRLKFNGTSLQTLPQLPSGAAFGDLYFANPAGVMLTENLTSVNFKGDLYVESGTLDDNRFAIIGTSVRNLTVADGARLNLRYSNVSTKEGFPANFATVNLLPNSTVIYNGNTGQKIAGRTYGNLEILGGVSKQRSILGAITANNVIVESDLLIGNFKIDIGNSTLTLKSDGKIQNPNASSYIVMGPTGRMVVEAIGQSAGARNTEVVFPIGTSAGYTPAYLTNNGATYNFAIGIENGVIDYASGNPIVQDGVNKTWNVECLNQVSTLKPNVDLRLQWNSVTDQLSKFDNTKCYVTHYTNGSWTTSDLYQNATNNGMSAIMKGIDSFSPFSVADAASPLPVELTFFKAARKENAVLLNWETASEKNCLGYDVLASADGKNFEFVGNVASKNGTANYVQQYEFLDKTSRTGLVYYRLKQTDLDGTVTYYATQVVDMGRFTETMVAFPNPFQNRFELKMQSAKAQDVMLQVKDLTGKTVYQNAPKVIAGETVIPVELSQKLPSGIYILTAKTADQLFTSRIIKQ